MTATATRRAPAPPPRRRHTVLWIAGTVGLAVLVLVAIIATQVGGDPQADDRTSALLDKPAPEVTVVGLDGKPIEIAELAGRAVLVNFWNTWCIPCKQEEPALREFAARHADDSTVALVAIVREDTETAVRDRLERDGDFGWTVALDPDAEAALEFGTRGQPETYAITPDGFVVGVQFGPSTVEILETLLDQARRA